jgi:hypothetical protein
MATRHEKVVLELDDRFTTRMAKAAATAALMERELDGLDGAGRRSSKATDDFGRSVDRSRASIDQYSGRLTLLAQAAAALGPALLPVGAVGIPAVTGLAAQFGFAALAVAQPSSPSKGSVMRSRR